MSFTFKSAFQSSFQTISGFSVPYVSRISGGLKAGKAIFIQGSVPSGCESFVVNLKCGESKGNDIAFQIRTQFSSNYMVLNSRQHGAWGKKEKLELPLKQGSSFDLIIAVNSENYQVYLNGSEVGQFQHRIPLDRVIALSVGGEVSLTNVVFTESWTGSSVFGRSASMTFGEHSSTLDESWSLTGSEHNLPTIHPQMGLSLSNTVQNPNLPYVAPISGGLREGMALYLKGVIPTNAEWFEINFKTGQSDSDDTAFHFNPRLHQKVVMNSFRNRKWEAKESVSDNPFKKGETFEMFTVIKSEGYQVYVNGKELYTFKHRIPLEKVSTLNISGHVVVSLFGFMQNWSASSFPTTFTSLSRSHGELSTRQSEILQPVQNPVYVNGKELYTFKHRIPLEKVSTLNISGHVVVSLFGFMQNWSASSFPTTFTSLSRSHGELSTRQSEILQPVQNPNWSASSFPTTFTSLSRSHGELSTRQSEILQPVQNPNLPYVAPISGGLREGMAFYLKGVIPTNADQFEINFKTGQSDSDDTAFHFNPRLHQKVVMNSFRNRKWEAKESVSDNPFKKGETFEMFTVIKSEGYQVYVNGKELYTFKHRIPLKKVSTLNINGDVAVNLSGFLKNWSASVFPTKVITKITTLGSSHGGLSTVQSEILQPVRNPNLPYVAPISGGLREGMALYLQGVVPTNADQFEINFKTGQSSNDDMAFQFNPRMDQKVAINSVINGSWGTEESVSDNPFKKGEAFEMFTVIKSEGYQVYVNGKELYTFKHRIPLEKVSTLNISGDVAVNLSGFLQNWSASVFPTKVITKITTLGSSHAAHSTVQSEILQPVQNPNLPYVAPISGGLREGMALYLKGVVPTNADQFEINFKTGPSSNDDMAFQFNPRMDQKVAMNSVINGSWGTEESVSDNPFKKGEAFEMFSVIKSEGFQVYVNGKELYTFKHRIPLEKVSTLNISGDVAVNLSGFLQNWSASVFPTEVTTKITTLGTSHGGVSTVQSEILQPVQNPNLPYVAPISGGLREGMALYLKGVVPTNADQFEINFKTGPSSNDDMAFQFKPRMDQKLAMNSIINGSWGTEESVSDNPFKKGEAFEMFTVIKSEGYQ
uniref:Galectin 4 n=1 Tax=Cyprinus carpio carpio TaxID=630221 RepID=A0A9J7YU52_CYPCA